MDSPLKVATPLVFVVTVLVPDRVPEDGLVPMATVTEMPEVGTGLPAASSTVTAGCVPKAAPLVELEGCVVNASLAAGPTVVTLTAELAALVAVHEWKTAVTVYV